MRFAGVVAAIYDIHGNLPALEAVVKELHQAHVDLAVVGGDVLPGPMPRETIECLLSLKIPVEFIHGNGDREVLSQMRGIESEWFGRAPEQWREPVRWSARQLPPEHEGLLAAWPSTLRLQVGGLGEVLFCHATPQSDTEVFTAQTSEDRLLPLFNEVNAPVVVCGHTHMQFDRMVGGTRVVNAGSVGMPFGEPGAYWVLLGPSIELRRTVYDGEKAAQRIRNTEYPQAEDFAERNILRPPSEAASLAAFSRVEVK